MADIESMKKEVKKLEGEIKNFEDSMLKAKTLKESYLNTLEEVYAIKEDELDSKSTELETEISTLESTLNTKVEDMKNYIQKLSDKLNE
jgi:cell division protein FtsB